MKKGLAMVLMLVLALGGCSWARQLSTQDAHETEASPEIAEQSPVEPSTDTAAQTTPRYPQAEWTPQALVDSYRNKTAPWEKSSGRREWRLWSQDGQHEFCIDYEGWLLIDDVRALPVDCPTLPSLLPLDLVQAYQTGTWNGLMAWSEDYGTRVYVMDNGQLCYVYNNPAAGAGADAPAYLYAGYDAEPWWEAETTADQFDVRLQQAAHTEDGQLCYEVVTAAYQVELPNGQLATAPTGKLLESYWRLGNGYWELRTTGLDHYRNGEPVESWQCMVDDYNYYTTAPDAATAEYGYRHAYLYTGDQLLALESDGKFQVVVDHAVVPYQEYQDDVVGAYYLDGDALKLYGDHVGTTATLTLVSQGVVRVIGYGAPFIAMSDGLSYCLNDLDGDGEPELVRLGAKTLEEYQAAWRRFDIMRGFDEFIYECQQEWQAEQSAQQASR